MILTVDLSNTHIHIGCADNGTIISSCRISTEKSRTADEYAVLISLLLERRGIEPQQLEGSVLSSVVPELTLTLIHALDAVTGHSTMVIGPGIRTGLNIRTDDPSALGSDFVAASVGAQSICPLPVVTITMDAAIAFGVTDTNGSLIGNIIAPGLAVSGDALAKRASQLRNFIPQAPGRYIGRNTDEAMRSGLIYGVAGMIDGLLQGIDEELGQRVNVIAAGLSAELVIPHCRREGIRMEPDLLHKGMWTIWKRNHKK